ncbi:Uncharacterized protein PHSC3_001144 [Chlamydiales bacterium STE3]|nr:Uncharacterized protein PHSC3_001144 [Chlamydiales bacterium STE3]
MSARYLIGIDLGTTNSAVAFVDLNKEVNPTLAVRNFLIPQIGANGKLEHRNSLPSYCYILDEKQAAKYSLPWQKTLSYVVGQVAWEEGTQVPTQLVHSAKSWLCHPHAYQKSALLPENASSSIQRISPLEASSRYLNHIRHAWNFYIAKGDPDKELEAQEIVLTIPASFDETARGLTLEAARNAGFKSLILLEEPQAAFYCWMANHEQSFKKNLSEGDIVLVVDIGGGTTDFSLIEVRKNEEKFSFDRIAVGSHLLLGGDNMDHAISHLIQSKMKEEVESYEETHALRFAARRAKEILLAEESPLTYQVVVQGRGASIIRNTQRVELAREELRNLLSEGFFGQYTFPEALTTAKKKALKGVGLPFEEEPSITKHLAQFLNKVGKRPSKVLFNGGAVKPKLFREAILHSLQTWFSDTSIQELETESFDFAVAKGAAHFAKARQGHSTRIGGGSPRSYYVEVNHEGESKALTLLERGCEEDQTFHSPFLFHLLPNTPVSFKVYASHTRLDDKIGQFSSIDPLEMLPLPTLQTVLKFGQTKELIPVHLAAKLSSIGVLELTLQSKNSEHVWNLAFNSGSDNVLLGFEKNRRIDETYDNTTLSPALDFLNHYFSHEGSNEKLMEGLEKRLNQPRLSWPISVLRKLGDHLLTFKNFPKQQERFWNALGFFLRPGFGFPLDEHRMKELWKLILADLQKGNPSDAVLLQKWIFYRRIAGGLGKGQQIRIAQMLLDDLQIKNGKFPIFKQRQENYLFSEKLRTLASLEWLEPAKKIVLGNAIIQRIISAEYQSADVYALGRVGARNLMYAPFTQALDKAVVEDWLFKLLDIKGLDNSVLARLCMQLASYSVHPHLNISKKLLTGIIERFPGENRLRELLEGQTALNEVEQELFFADQLPIGLILKNSP